MKLALQKHRSGTCSATATIFSEFLYSAILESSSILSISSSAACPPYTVPPRHLPFTRCRVRQIPPIQYCEQRLPLPGPTCLGTFRRHHTINSGIKLRKTHHCFIHRALISIILIPFRTASHELLQNLQRQRSSKLETCLLKFLESTSHIPSRVRTAFHHSHSSNTQHTIFAVTSPLHSRFSHLVSQLFSRLSNTLSPCPSCKQVVIKQ